MSKHTIEERVMANVALVYATRLMLSRTALKLYALLGSAAGIVALVSISNVATNFVNVAQGGVGSVAVFTVSAVLGTTLIVQVALAVAAFSAVSLVTPFFRHSRALA